MLSVELAKLKKYESYFIFYSVVLALVWYFSLFLLYRDFVDSLSVFQSVVIPLALAAIQLTLGFAFEVFQRIARPKSQAKAVSKPSASQPATPASESSAEETMGVALGGLLGGNLASTFVVLVYTHISDRQPVMSLFVYCLMIYGATVAIGAFALMRILRKAPKS